MQPPHPRARTPARRPRNLHEIGRSTAHFLEKHANASESAFQRMIDRERRRLLRHLINGTCEPRDISRILATLKQGWREGKQGISQPVCKIEAPKHPFRRFPAMPSGHRVISERLIGRRAKLGAGERISLFRFSRTSLRHHLGFVEPGIWLQTGGQFGPSRREAPVFRWCRFAERVEEETRRVAMQRGIGEN